jgi:hypothetical protein
MPHQRLGRKTSAPLQLNHDQAQERLLAYCYGRLTRVEEAAFEAHVAHCAACRAEGWRHLAAERAHALQQRPQKQRKPRVHRLLMTVCAVTGLLVGLSGFLVVSAAYNGPLRGFDRHIAATVITAPAATQSPTPTPLMPTPQTTLPVRNVTTLAWSPNGTLLATAAAPDPATHSHGGVVVYKRAAGTFLFWSLPGFEDTQPPGTLAWSPDGTLLAAVGRAHILLWNATTGQLLATLALPTNPGTSLYTFDVNSTALLMSAPATIFAATGAAAWGANGTISAATTSTGTARMTLWDSQQGVRIFRDANHTVLMGDTDADVQAHAAFLRWSPDQRFLAWGYPRLPVTPTLLSQRPPGLAATTLGVPDATFATAVRAVTTSTQPNASVTLWPTDTATRRIVFDATQPTPMLSFENATTGATLATFTIGSATLTLNALSCQHAQPLLIAIAGGAMAITLYGA